MAFHLWNAFCSFDDNTSGVFTMNGMRDKREIRMELMIEIKTKPEKLQELYQTLQSLLSMIRKEKGCLEYRLYRDTEEEKIFFISINWQTQANLENYLRSVSGNAFLGAIDLLSETARVRFGKKRPWKGIDALKKMKTLP